MRFYGLKFEIWALNNFWKMKYGPHLSIFESSLTIFACYLPPGKNWKEWMVWQSQWMHWLTGYIKSKWLKVTIFYTNQLALRLLEENCYLAIHNHWSWADHIKTFVRFTRFLHWFFPCCVNMTLPSKQSVITFACFA